MRSGEDVQGSVSFRDGAAALGALFAPQAVAIVGASGRPGNPFARPLEYLVRHGFKGHIYPVNPRYPELQGRECFRALEDLPGPIDLALLMVPSQQVVELLPRVAAAGARVAVVFASGFGETGTAGRRLEAQMLSTAREHGLRILGPNCQGVLSVHDRFPGTFSAAVESDLPPAGNIAYVGQSGAIGGSVLSLALERGIGFATWASTGNESDITSLEIATHLVDDSRIDVIAIYTERGLDGRGLEILAAAAASRGVSIVVLQSGLSAAGARAAASHTGAIVGSNAGFEAMAREFGIVVADDVEDFIAMAQVMSVLPRATGRRVAVVTTSGGGGSLTADRLEAEDLEVVPLAGATQEALSGIVPGFGAVANPVDVTAQLFQSGDTSEFIRVCETVLEDSGVDSLIVLLTMVTGDLAAETARGLRELWRTSPKPIVVVWLAALTQTSDARAILAEEGWPVSASPRQAARLLGVLSPPRGPSARRACEQKVEGLDDLLRVLDTPVLTEADAGALLALAGIRQPELMVAATGEEASEFAEEVGSLVVLKIQSPSIIHKSEHGGVRVLGRSDDVNAAFDEMRAAFAGTEDARILVQRFVDDGLDLLVGLTKPDPSFPPLLTVGRGGIEAEVHGDFVCRLAPVDAAGVHDMLMSLRCAPLLAGFRGSAGVDLERAAEAIATLSQVAVGMGDRLVELEINPLRIVGRGHEVLALDAMLQVTCGATLGSRGAAQEEGH